MSNITFKDTLIMAGISIFLITIVGIGIEHGIKILLKDDIHIIEHFCTRGCKVSAYYTNDGYEPCLESDACDGLFYCMLIGDDVPIVNVSISEVNCQ